MVPCEVSAVVRIGLAIAKGVDIMRETGGMQSDREPESWTAVVLGVLPFLLPMLVLLGPFLDAVYAALGWRTSQTKIAGSLVVTRPVERQFRLLTNMWQDWTLLSFALYGMFILGTLLAGDEIDSPWKRPVAAGLKLRIWWRKLFPIPLFRETIIEES